MTGRVSPSAGLMLMSRVDAERPAAQAYAGGCRERVQDAVNVEQEQGEAGGHGLLIVPRSGRGWQGARRVGRTGRTAARSLTARPGSGASPQAEREHRQRAEHYQPGHQAPQPAEHRRRHDQDGQQDDGQDRRRGPDLCSSNMRSHIHKIAYLFDI